MQFSLVIRSFFAEGFLCELAAILPASWAPTVEGRSDAKTMAACHDHLLTPLVPFESFRRYPEVFHAIGFARVRDSVMFSVLDS
jgi:hypothetical protein